MQRIKDVVHPKGLVVRQGIMQVARPIEVNPFSKQYCVIPFSQEIVAIIETETETKLVLDGEVIQEGNTHNDFYGFLTSTQTMWGFKKPTAPVIREVTVTAYLSYYIPELRDKSNTHRNLGYYNLPNDWYDVGANSPEENSIENMNAWYNTYVFDRYVKDDNGDFQPIMPEPDPLEKRVVGTAQFHSDMGIEEQIAAVSSMLDSIDKEFPQNREFMNDSFEKMAQFARNPDDPD